MMDMDINLQCGSPAGMGQLIKYFESQSRRLDKQSYHAHLGCLNSEFDSMIKFNGVPILPPAMTSSRRDEVRQFKKDAILLEKRSKARQRRQLMAKTDMSKNSQVMFPENRPTARHLNFDSDVQDGGIQNGTLKDRLGASNPGSTFATAETALAVDDFGLHSMDTMNSDFMSLEGEAIPTVFSGFKLNSYKEQKISYDLDRLSKVLNVQELNSTSGSDLSDALANTQTSEEDLKSAAKWAEKVLLQKAVEGGNGQSASFFHESQDTVVEVSPGDNITVNSSTSGFVDTTTMEQGRSSINSSPGCGSLNTIESQRSSRSSPKSLKNAVHFASFVTEYINTSTSQSFESTTIVTKKMPEKSPAKSSSDIRAHCADGVLPIIGDPSETRNRHNQPNKGSHGNSSINLLNKVSLNPDTEVSHVIPPCDQQSGMPFQGYGRNEAYSSDKENESSNAQRNHHGQRNDHASQRSKGIDNIPERVNPHQHGGRLHRYSEGDKEDCVRSQEERRSSSGNKSLTCQNFASAGVGPQDFEMFSGGTIVGSSQLSEESVTKLPVGEVTTGKMSVSDSQGSNKSNSLTATSGSSSSTIKDDLSVRDMSKHVNNIVETGRGQANLHEKSDEDSSNFQEESTKPQNILDVAPEQMQSPKKLNIDPLTNQEECSSDSDGGMMPAKKLVRTGSYTLNEPSPVLLRARSKLEARDQERNQNAQISSFENGNLTDNTCKDNEVLKKKLNFESSPEPLIIQDETKVMNIQVPSEPEKEGKAEIINKYLNQVQFQNSMNFSHQSWDIRDGSQVEEDDMYPDSVDDGETEEDVHNSIMEIVRSLNEGGQSLELDAEQLTLLHQQRLEGAKKDLIMRQQSEMEELFVQQRRETMLLAVEIKAAQQLEREQQEFLMQNAPENLKVKARGHDREYSPEHTSNFDESNNIKLQNIPPDVRSNVTEVMNSLNNMRPQSSHRSSYAEYGSKLKLQPKSFPIGNMKVGNSSINSAELKRKSAHTAMNTSSDSVGNKSHQTRVKTVSSDDSFSPRGAPPQHLSGYHRNIPELIPSPVSSPRLHRHSALRSPMKFMPSYRKEGKVVVPPEAHLPEMMSKFDRISAVAKGFLTRCLLRSDKVQEIIKTIKDTREFAFNFQTETPIKKGVFTAQDRSLLERIVAQLQAGLLDIHEIFFDIPVAERMAIIEQTRIKEHGKRVRNSKDSLRGSCPRISQATLKALERKKKAREAEASALLSTSYSRPTTAPSSTSPRYQNNTDISGPLRRHFGFLFTRALKPLHGHSQGQTQSSTARHESSRSEKERPRTAPEKQLTRPKRITAPSHSKPSSSVPPESSKDSQKEAAPSTKQGLASKLLMKSKVAPAKSTSSRPTKSWR